MEDLPNFIWLSGSVISCCFQLAIPCYLGSYLADKMDQISFNLYESNWPDMSPRFKSTMIIVLELGKQSVNICAWNLFIISLPTFVSVSELFEFVKLSNENKFNLVCRCCGLHIQCSVSWKEWNKDPWNYYINIRASSGTHHPFWLEIYSNASWNEHEYSKSH